MNQRNVGALRSFLTEWGRRVDQWQHTEGLAEFLADRGVLVPSTLTDKDVKSHSYGVAVLDGYHGEEFAVLDRDELVVMLERLAKGESS